MAHCCLCNGDLVFIGQLGHTKQFRCRHCGMIFSAVRRARRNLSGDPVTKPHDYQAHEKNSDVAP